MGKRATQFHPEVHTKHFAADVEPQGNVSQPQLKVVYVFAGHRRRADVREHLEDLAKSQGFTLNLHEVDLVRGQDHDVLDETVWTNLVSFIRDFSPFCIIATPPCSTYSRARHLYKRFPDLAPYDLAITPWAFHG